MSRDRGADCCEHGRSFDVACMACDPEGCIHSNIAGNCAECALDAWDRLDEEAKAILNAKRHGDAR